eukprot:scaffold162_cov176-Amphora_coffeaeformis.AAC.29
MSVHDRIATPAFKGAGNGGKSNTENSRVGRPGLANNTVRRRKGEKCDRYCSCFVLHACMLGNTHSGVASIAIDPKYPVQKRV